MEPLEKPQITGVGTTGPYRGSTAGSDVKAVSLVTLLRFFSLLLPDLTKGKKAVFTLKLPRNH